MRDEGYNIDNSQFQVVRYADDLALIIVENKKNL